MKRPRLTLEYLEDRSCPAPLNFSYTSLGDLTITGHADNSGASPHLKIEMNTPGFLDITDGAATTFTMPAPGSVTVAVNNAVPGPLAISIDLMTNTLTGSLSINGVAAEDSIEITNGTIQGGLRVSGIGDSAASIHTFLNLTVGGNVSIDRGPLVNTGFSYNFSFSNSTIGGNFNYSGAAGGDSVGFQVNVAIGGSVYVSMGQGSNFLNVADTTTIGGSLTYIGGDDDDNITSLDGTVGGYVSLQLRNGPNNITVGSTALLASSMTVQGGGGNDSINNFDGTLAGDLIVNFGSGDNNVTFGGTLHGRRFQYTGGVGIDDITITATASMSLAYLSFSLGASNDTLNLNINNFRYLFVDFGAGSDTFLTTVSLASVSFRFLNLP